MGTFHVPSACPAERRSHVRFFMPVGRAGGVALLACVVVTPAQAAVTQCFGGPEDQNLCASNETTCTIATGVAVAVGANIDCGPMNLTIGGNGRVYVVGGSFALSAQNLSIANGGSIEAVPGNADTADVGGFDLHLSGALDLQGKLIAQNNGPGSQIAAEVVGPIVIGGANPAIDLRGVTQSSDGGDLYLSSGASIELSRKLLASGYDGTGDENESTGGTVTLVAGSNVHVSDEIQAAGRRIGGGDLVIFAGHDVQILSPAGAIRADGRGDDGYGGSVEIRAGHRIEVSGPIDLRGGSNQGGGNAGGGELYLDAGCGGIGLSAAIDLSGGADGGGVAFANATGTVSLTSSISAKSLKLGGRGGVVHLSSGGTLSLTAAASIDAKGHVGTLPAEAGGGGEIALSGCLVDLPATGTTAATMTAWGYHGGSILLEGRKSPLALLTDQSIRISKLASVSAAGQSDAGTIAIDVKQQRSGTCSNTHLQCGLSSECASGCLIGTCGDASPDTEGVQSQFTPLPTTHVRASIPACEVCN